MASTRKKTSDAAAETPAAPAVSADPDLKAAAAAFARLADERKSLGQVEPPQGDLRAALDTARKALPRLQQLRGAIAEALPRHPMQYLDKLDDYIQAVWFSEQLVTLTSHGEAGSDRYNEMVEQGRNLRKILLATAELLVMRNLLDSAKVQAIRSGAGHDDMATDLTELAALYNEAWPRVKNKGVEKEEVEQAEKLGQELQSLLVLRKSDAAKLSPEETTAQRDRAFALLARAYEENQRAVGYVRWHDKDADQIAPTLVRAKRGRPAKGETTASPPPVAEAESPAASGDDMPNF